MMKIFAASIFAQRPLQEPYGALETAHFPTLSNWQGTEEEFEDHCIAIALENLPESDGWVDHRISIVTGFAIGASC